MRDIRRACLDCGRPTVLLVCLTCLPARVERHREQVCAEIVAEAKRREPERDWGESRLLKAGRRTKKDTA